VASAGNWNFLHPEVEQAMLDVAGELGKKFKGLPNFLGVNWTSFFGGGFIPSFRTGPKDEQFNSGYDDAAIAAFVRDTGIAVPGAADDPERFQKRYAFLTAPAMQPHWAQWRAQKMRDFFTKVSQRLKEQRVDLECFASCYLHPVSHVKEWMNTGKSFQQYAYNWGWDKDLFAEDPSLWLTVFLGAAGLYQPSFRADEYALSWQGNVEPELYAGFDLGQHRSVMLEYLWLEVERVTALMPWRSDWPRPYQSTMQTQQAGDFAKEPYIQAMIGLDPNLVMFGFTDASLYIGQEQQLRDFARVLRSLPTERFQPYKNTGFKTNFAIRELKKDGKLYFYVVNPGYWPVKGSVTVQNAAKIVNLASSEQTAQGTFSSNVKVPVALGPFGIVSFVAEGQKAEISGWSVERLSARDLRHMENIIAAAKKAAAVPGLEQFIGAEKYAFLKKSAADAEKDISAGEYARAWATLTDGNFWTIVYQRVQDIKYVEIIKPKSMVLEKIIAAPKLDGKLDDPAWKQIKPLGGFVTGEKMVALFETFVYACHDGTNLYVAFDCRDKEPGKVRKTARDEMTLFSSGDDLVDVFIRPDLNKLDYFQLAANVAGVKFDQQCKIDGARNYGFQPAWEAHGAVNDRGWTMELKIPAASLNAGLKSGDKWGINFHRIFREGTYPAASWSYNKANWHDVDQLGVMTVK